MTDFNDIIFNNDIMDIIGTYVKKDNYKRIQRELFKAVEETNEKLLEFSKEFYYKNEFICRGYNGIFIPPEVWDGCREIISEIEYMNVDKIYKYYYEKQYLRCILNNVRYSQIYLNVKYKDKNDAKKLGAKWDPNMKQWYGYVWQKDLIEKYKF